MPNDEPAPEPPPQSQPRNPAIDLARTEPQGVVGEAIKAFGERAFSSEPPTSDAFFASPLPAGGEVPPGTPGVPMASADPSAAAPAPESSE